MNQEEKLDICLCCGHKQKIVCMNKRRCEYCSKKKHVSCDIVPIKDSTNNSLKIGRINGDKLQEYHVKRADKNYIEPSIFDLEDKIQYLQDKNIKEIAEIFIDNENKYKRLEKEKNDLFDKYLKLINNFKRVLENSDNYSKQDIIEHIKMIIK